VLVTDALQQAADQLDWPTLIQLLQAQFLTHEVNLTRRSRPTSTKAQPQAASQIQASQPIAPKLTAEERDRYRDWLFLALTEGDFQIRWDAAKLIPLLGVESVLPPLLEQLRSEETDPELRWFVVRILGNWPQPDVIAALLDLLQTCPDAEVQGMAASVLAGLGHASVQAIAPLLQDPAQRQLATQMLAQIRNRETLPLLLNMTQDVDGQVRAIALDAVSSFQSEAVTAALDHALEDPSVRVRMIAVRGLGFCHAIAPEPYLAKLAARLWDVDLGVCHQAAMTLGRLGWVAAVEPLQQVLRSPVIPDRLGEEVVRSLVWINQPAALQALSQALQDYPLTPAVTQTLLRGLGQIEAPELQDPATQILLDALPHAAADQQVIIVSALGQLNQGRAIAPLQTLLLTAAAPLRWHILAALKRLSPQTEARSRSSISATR
jgi:HEAT repeat protein